jgi:hypothetical protein
MGVEYRSIFPHGSIIRHLLVWYADFSINEYDHLFAIGSCPLLSMGFLLTQIGH